MTRKDQMDKKRKESEPAMYEQLTQSCEELSEEEVPCGYVPVLVGMEAAMSEKFMVHVTLFKDPCMVVLLDMAAQEFGYRQQGILRIPCDVEHFRRVLDVISETR